MARRDPAGFAKRYFTGLLVVFGAFVALGLWRDNWAALAGGAAGIAWVLWRVRK